MITAVEQTTNYYDDFGEKLDRYIAENNEIVAVMIVEACNMPRIDARFGRAHRDKCLLAFAKSIHEAIRDSDYATQIGEHTFAVIFGGLKNKGHANLAGKKLLRLIQPDSPEPSRDTGVIKSRIGVALCPEHAQQTIPLIRAAQLALEIAKDSQKDLVVYNTDTVETVAESWELRDDLAEAIRESELEVFYQPKLKIQTDEVYGAEALIRWFSAKRGPVSPETFIPVAENSELIEPLTRYILNSAMRSMMMWQRDGHDIGIAVNIPSQMMLQGGIVNMVGNLLSIWDLEPGRLTLEMTESAIVSDVDLAFKTMTGLKEKGVRISIDDFGTGYSSFSYFKNIPADELKIDQTFVSGMKDDIADQHIVETIIGLAHRFNMQVVAEGIENQESLDLLKALKCDIGQGYHIAKPLSQENYDSWLDARRYSQPGDYE